MAKKKISKILTEGDSILKKNKIKIFQSVNSRINQTLSSKRHTMSMLNAYNTNRPIEIVNLWKSFDYLIHGLKTKMSFTKKVFQCVNQKILKNR